MSTNKNTPSNNFGVKILGFISLGVLAANVAVGRISLYNADNELLFETHFPILQDTNQKVSDSTKVADLKFPLNDQTNQYLDSFRKQQFDLKDPNNYTSDIQYNADSNQYQINQKVGEYAIGNPTTLNYEEYYRLRALQDQNDYFQQRLEALGMFTKKPTLPALSRKGLFDRLFGGNSISIQPQGNLTIGAGIFAQNMQNPNIAVKQRKYMTPDFDMLMNVNLAAQIGSKLKINLSNNTGSTFGNQQETRKIEYTGDQDAILKKFEAGNVNFPLRSSLVTGMNSLFGLKTQLQFGKLWVTGVMSQQKSQKKSLALKGGSLTTQYEIKINDYEENKNFLLGHYFYDNYEKALENFPIINSQVVINKVEVWITNRTGSTTNVRDALAFMDLGESNPYLNSLQNPAAKKLPDNRANLLYDRLQQNQAVRKQSTASNAVNGMGLTEGQDFQRSTMRKLNASEFSFNPQLGYINLNVTPNASDVIAVAYSYTYNGEVHQVGEFSEDITPDSSAANLLYLKLLKGTSARVSLPVWDLMMKNVYSVGSGNLSQKDFQLNVLYQDPGGGLKRYLPEGPSAGTPIISLLNLDRLNANRDPFPDGVFDWVENITVVPQQGKIIFPKLKPFASGLADAFGGDPALIRKYSYDILYDSTKAAASQSQANNRFLIKGQFASTSGSEIRLNGFNIAQGSVTVNAGGQILSEGSDYQVDYSSGLVRILNQGILNSGVQINIQYEDNATFGQNQQSFYGTRFDYYANDKLSLGATYMRLNERPLTTNISQGYDPISNTVLGADVNYQSESKWMTRALNNILPNFSSKAPSLISASGEVAAIIPGHSKFINISGDEGGTVYVDDFEGAGSSIDLKSPATNWKLASVPAKATDENGRELFPESSLSNDIDNGKNRALLAWYNLEPTLLSGPDAPANVKSDTALQDYWRQIYTKEIFPKKSTTTSQNLTNTFDLSFFPKDRGPYNFDLANVDRTTGELLNPTARWGGVQRAIDQSDFEAANVEYITFWMLDPYIYNENSKGGYLYFNLGDVSEDVLKDSRLFFENSVPYPYDVTKLDRTPWGVVPRFQQQITRAFDQSEAARAIQDVGYDGLTDEQETQQFQRFLANAQSVLSPEAFSQISADPASDNYHHYRGSDYDAENRNVLSRYKKFNLPHGNSPIASSNTAFTSAATNLPESEDINNDNTLNENEAYYEYRVKIEPNMQVNTNFIVDKVQTEIELHSGRKSLNTWYQFKIPIKEYKNAVGGISDFRSIRFARMFLNGFEDSVTLRFAELQLDRSLWRRYEYSLTKPGEKLSENDSIRTSVGLTTVNIEANSGKTPIKYVSPPGIIRQRQFATTGETIERNEQSLALQIKNLVDGDGRAVYKQLFSDMRKYTQLKMFIHAESIPSEQSVQDGELVAFIRIGSDFTKNYYEYEVPLKITDPSATSANDIWPDANQLLIELQDLVNLKERRNQNNIPTYYAYEGEDRYGRKMRVIGSPSIGDVKNFMLGVKNPSKTTNTGDDGLPKSVEVWFDELRLVGLEETGGYAASGQVNIQLADLGTVRAGGTMHTVGYGSINQRVGERAQDDYYQYDLNTNLNLGKVLPKSWGVQLPFYVGYNQSVSNPEFDPYDTDIKMKEKLSRLSGEQRREAQELSQDYLSITSLNLTNVRFTGNPDKPKVPGLLSLRNLDLSLAYNRQFHRTPLIQSEEILDQRFLLNYNYTFRGKPWEPFRKRIKSKSKWLDLARDFNINYVPTNFSFTNELKRDYSELIVRNIDRNSDYEIPAYYYKNFVWNRRYSLRWELTKKLSIAYSGLNISRIDEPYGRIDSREKRDSLWTAISTLGRNTYFNQNFDVTYALPLQKIPALNWTNVSLTYGSTYEWTAASLLARSLGNTIGNTQLRQINAEFNFSQLYNKSRWLRGANRIKPNDSQGKLSALKKSAEDQSSGSGSVKNVLGGNAPKGAPTETGKNDPKKPLSPQVPPKPKRKEVTEKDIKGYDTLAKEVLAVQLAELKKKERKKYREAMIAWRKRKNNIIPEMSSGTETALRFATMLKRISINYRENYGSTLPGYMDSTVILGANTRNGMNGLGYAFGFQPTAYWLDQQMKNSSLSKDSLMNNAFLQTYSQQVGMKGSIEPFRDFRIDLNLDKNFTKNQSFINKYDWLENQFAPINPYYAGSFNQTVIGLGGFFNKNEISTLSTTYEQFMSNRKVISSRLGNSNAYTGGELDPNDPNYYKGYTGFSQDVLIPAFLSAYLGKDPKSIGLVDYNNSNVRNNPFKYFLPAPNWKLTYNGLHKLELFSNIFENFTLNHAYTGKMSMNSFVNNLFYQDYFGIGMPSFIDSNTNNFIPFYQVPNLTVTENFGPLIGMNMTFKNALNLTASFGKSRMVSLSLIDYQVSETNSSEFMVGAGFRKKGLVLPITFFGVKELKNDVNFKMEIGIRNDMTTITNMALNQAKTSAGQKVISIYPTIDYVINDKTQLQFYFDRKQTIPSVSTSYPITITRAGFKLIFLLAGQ